jgi:tetratricopeptide (TPR) repeat protein
MCVLLAFLLIAASDLYSQNLPEWFIPLRDSVYEQNLKADQIVSLYQGVKDRAGLSMTGADLYLMLSRCEYMMGRAYQYEERKDEAARYYDAGMSWAEKSLEAGESAEAWRMLAENISQSCVVRSTAYAMANGLKVERYSKNALAINRRNAAAQYMIAARWVFAPAPFNNLKKGIEMMEAIITEGDMEKDDRFNVFSAIGYAYIQQKKYPQARSWLLKSLEVFPDNKFVQELLKKC